MPASRSPRVACPPNAQGTLAAPFAAPLAAQRVRPSAYSASHATIRDRLVPAEAAIALVYDGTTEAVMMATPADLEDFALGFSLTEAIVSDPGEIEELSVHAVAEGVELRMWLAPDRAAHYRGRRRNLAGPTGCGLCGVDSLAAAIRRPPRLLGGISLAPEEMARAVETLAAAQRLNHATRATHAAGLFVPGRGLVSLREDVGRHNALDKLAGALARDRSRAAEGAIVITSRVSVEMVLKTAAIGATVLIAISAPTALAIRMADAAGMTLIACVRGSSFEVFTHPERVGAQPSRCWYHRLEAGTSRQRISGCVRMARS